MTMSAAPSEMRSSISRPSRDSASGRAATRSSACVKSVMASHEHVLELVGLQPPGCRGLFNPDQPRFQQLLQVAPQEPRRHGGNGGKEPVGELAADNRCELCDLLDRAEPIQPCHQRVTQRGRNGEGLVCSRLQRGTGEFLDEQRDAIGLVQDLPDHRLREPAAARHRADEPDGFAILEPGESP